MYSLSGCVCQNGGPTKCPSTKPKKVLQTQHTPGLNMLQRCAAKVPCKVGAQRQHEEVVAWVRRQIRVKVAPLFHQSCPLGDGLEGKQLNQFTFMRDIMAIGTIGIRVAYVRLAGLVPRSGSQVETGLARPRPKA